MLSRLGRNKQNNKNIRVNPETLAARTAASLASIAINGAPGERTSGGVLWSPAAKMSPEPSAAALAERNGPSKGAIRKLEQIPMLPSRKTSILLASLGQKPMGMTGLDSPAWYEGQPPQVIPDNEYADTVHALQDLGLHVHALDRISTFIGPEGQAGRQLTRLITASQSEGLLTMADSALGQRTAEDQRILGAAFGYPPTATEAYIAGRGLSPRDATDDPELRAFATYALSPEHAQSELGTAHRWAAQVKAVSPAIYNEQVMTIRDV
jgi:hypothetical protein